MAGNRHSSSEEVDECLKSLREEQMADLPLEKMEHLLHKSTSIPCIYRVPDLLREQNRDAYCPRCVSIGPLHRTNPTLDKMNEYKLAYMHRLFARIEQRRPGTYASAQKECMEYMIDGEKEARNYYAEYVKPSKKHEFAMMMLIDGCFIIELLYSFKCKRKKKDPILDNNFMNLAVRHDLLLLENQIPFFVLQDLFELTVRKILADEDRKGHHCICDYLRSFFGDMMRGINFTDGDTKKKGDDSDIANHHILNILCNSYSSEAEGRERKEEHSVACISNASLRGMEKESEDRKCKFCDTKKKAGHTTYNHNHILDLLRRCYISPSEAEAEAKKAEEEENTPPSETDEREREEDAEAEAEAEAKKKHRKFKSSATTLDLAGVSLKGVTNTTESLFFDVKFTTVCCFPFCRKKWSCSCCLLDLFKSNYLEIPTFSIYDTTETFLRNVIAFEQCSHGISRYFTSFAILMDRLVDSPKDIELLERGEVLRNHLGSSEEAKDLFNNIGKHVAGDDEMYFEKEWAGVEKYLERRSPRFITALKRDYFSSPWTIISVCAAIVLFVLTLLQTIYSMLSYY